MYICIYLYQTHIILCCSSVHVWSSCDLMQQAPFTDCQDVVDPTPYINVCKQISCKYPEGDGVSCSFFEAYVKTCSMKGKITVADWRSTVSCCKISLFTLYDSNDDAGPEHIPVLHVIQWYSSGRGVKTLHQRGRKYSDLSLSTV